MQVQFVKVDSDREANVKFHTAGLPLRSIQQRAVGFHIRQKTLFTLHPNSLVFASASDDELSSSAILRVKKGLLRGEDRIELICVLPNGKIVKSQCSKLTDEIYRIELEIEKENVKDYR